jgi:hypothetical protein
MGAMVSTECGVTPPGWRLDRFRAAVHLSVTREVAQRIDVRAGVASHGDEFGRGTAAVLQHVLAVLFGEAHRERRMRGEVRHAGVERLREVVDLRFRGKLMRSDMPLPKPHGLAACFLAALRRVHELEDLDGFLVGHRRLAGLEEADDLFTSVS